MISESDRDPDEPAMPDVAGRGRRRGDGRFALTPEELEM